MWTAQARSDWKERARPSTTRDAASPRTSVSWATEDFEALGPGAATAPRPSTAGNARLSVAVPPLTGRPSTAAALTGRPSTAAALSPKQRAEMQKRLVGRCRLTPV